MMKSFALDELGELRAQRNELLEVSKNLLRWAVRLDRDMDGISHTLRTHIKAARAAIARAEKG